MNIKGTIRFTSLLLAVLFGSCKNKAVDYSLFEIKEEHVQAESTNAVISGAYSFRGEVNGMKFNLGTNENLSDALIYDMLLEGDEFSIALDSLIPNTTYYYCYGVDFGLKNEYITEIKSFRTLQGEPLVKTIEIISQGEFSRKVKCEVVSDGGGTITERGIFWNTNGNPGVNDHKVKHAENGVGEYVCIMDGLEPNTTYYVRAYAKNDTGIGLAQEVLQFETHDNPSDSLMIVIDCNPPSGGTATGGGTFSFGQRCTVTATANEGYAFTQWTENGNQVSTEASYTFTVDRNRTLVANFTESPSTIYTITVSANPNNGGSVSGGGTFNQGASCTIHATANSGYTFVNWTENGTQVSTNANYTFTVTGNRSLVAHFQQQQQQYTISVSANPSTGGDVSGGGTFNYGQSCTVYASPTAGYTFTKWTENGSLVSTNANYTFTVTGNRSLVAHFQQQQQQYTISVSANPSNGGNVSGGGTFPTGSTCTVTATANTGFTFVNWTENGSVVSTNANYTITVDSDRYFVANFKPSDAIGGVFTINPDNDQVYFSKGNLQYKASMGTWRFAEHQWDYVGGTTNDNVVYGTVYENGVRCSNNMISQTYSGWIDLFGWGTGNNPTNSSSNSSNYSTFTDWGVNSIGNSVNQWRTLTQTEWDYILNKREASSLNGVPNARYAKAKVSGVAGLILFPDNYNHPDNIPISGINDPGTNYSVNEYNSSQWSQMEYNGCVFLPAAGRRNGTHFTLEFNDGQDGYYWSSPWDYYSGVLHFDNNHLKANADIARYIGLCVRLVHPIQ